MTFTTVMEMKKSKLFAGSIILVPIFWGADGCFRISGYVSALQTASQFLKLNII